MSRDLVVKALGLRSLNEEHRTVEFIASTDALDSYDEIVSQENWELKRFLSNPVILYAHNSRELPIGKAVRCEVVTANGKKQLECTVKIATGEANPLAENVWQSLKQETLRSVSVGFHPNTVRYEKRDGKDVYVLDDNELYEISVVAIPANPEAVAKMRSKARESALHHGHEKQGAAQPGEDTMNFALIAATLGIAAASNATEKDILDAAKYAKARSDRYEEAEKNLQDSQKDLSESRAKVADAAKALDIALADKVKADVAKADAEAAKDAAEKASKAAADKLVELEVEALVGVKITPAEKDEMIEFAKESPVRFKKQMALRADMTALKGAIIPKVEKAGPKPTTATSSGAGEDLAALIEAAADSEETAA